MSDLVTIDEVRDQLRIDGPDSDAPLSLLIEAVEHAVERWCGGPERVRDQEGLPLPQARLACLVEIAYQFAHSDGPTMAYEGAWAERGYSLSIGATSLLQSLHSTVVA